MVALNLLEYSRIPKQIWDNYSIELPVYHLRFNITSSTLWEDIWSHLYYGPLIRPGRIFDLYHLAARCIQRLSRSRRRSRVSIFAPTPFSEVYTSKRLGSTIQAKLIPSLWIAALLPPYTSQSVYMDSGLFALSAIMKYRPGLEAMIPGVGMVVYRFKISWVYEYVEMYV